MWGWHRCEQCSQLRFREKKHVCPEQILQNRQDNIAKEAEIEMTLFEDDWQRFLNSREGKFRQWLAQKEREE